VLISSGLEYLESEQQQEHQVAEQLPGQAMAGSSTSSLEAFRLVLIDNILMAAHD
jgi:hypothetical protein